MPRGIRNVKVVEMKESEVDAMQPAAVEVVGNLEKKKLSGEEIKKRAEASKLFPKIEVDYSSWIPMTNEEAIQHGKDGRLVGYEPNLGIGLLDKSKLMKK